MDKILASRREKLEQSAGQMRELLDCRYRSHQGHTNARLHDRMEAEADNNRARAPIASTPSTKVVSAQIIL